MIKRLEHMALSVADIQRSIDFYCGVLGLELVRQLDCGAETSLGKVVGLPNCSAKIAHLMCGETMLELFEYTSPRGESMPPARPQADHGFVHGIAAHGHRPIGQALRQHGNHPLLHLPQG